MKKNGLFPAMVVMILAAGTLFTGCTDPQKMYDGGFAQYNAGEYDKAIATFTKVLAKAPAFENAYNIRGCAYMAKGEYFKAVEDFTKSIENNPDNYPAYANRGASYYNLKEYDNAVKDLTTYTNKHPDSADNFKLLGFSYYQLQKHTEAAAFFTKALEIAPSFELYIARAASYAGQGKLNPAASDCKNALKLDPENQEAKDLLAAVNVEIKNQEERESRAYLRRLMGSGTGNAYQDAYNFGYQLARDAFLGE